MLVRKLHHAGTTAAPNIFGRTHPSGRYDAHYHNPKASVEPPDSVCRQHLAHDMRGPLQSQVSFESYLLEAALPKISP